MMRGWVGGRGGGRLGGSVYPVGGLSPPLLGRNRRLGGHGPAPEHFVVMYGNVGLLWQAPVETNCHQTFISLRHVGDTQAARAWRGGRVWRTKKQTLSRG